MDLKLCQPVNHVLRNKLMRTDWVNLLHNNKISSNMIAKSHISSYTQDPPLFFDNFMMIAGVQGTV